ncbi:hypothetical protein V6N11_051901 [Hibiscus sabdariffa]|uniref:Uncharacterized protein n=1 Tax=Hibiscus sabdariffa TaxID=183260 RepID=A0ABR2U906_9ROSI
MHDTSTLLLPTADRFVGPGGRPSDGLPEVTILRKPRTMHDTSTLLLPTADRFVGPGGRPSDGLPEVGEIRLSEVADVAMDETLTTLGRSIGRTVVGDSLTWIDKGKASYASMAARNNGVSGKSSISSGLSDDYIVVLEDDYVIDHSGTILSIKFSDRVHGQIDITIRNAIIVPLLGRSIGFQTLNTCSTLESGLIYYKDTSISCQVWILLPGLPYRYYSKALFRLIAIVVGRVVKIDYSTLGGGRSKFARLVVMIDLMGTGLFVTQSMNKKETVHNKQSEPTENELYGPWMTVDTRHRRSSYVLNNRGGSTKDSRSKLEVGSRFASLVKEDSTVLGKEFRRRTSPQLQ